jgi:hypothetical protein
MTDLRIIQTLPKRTLYALYTPEGKFVHAHKLLKDVVNYLPKGMPSKLHNTIFHGNTTRSVKALRAHGWYVVVGEFVPGPGFVRRTE